MQFQSMEQYANGMSAAEIRAQTRRDAQSSATRTEIVEAARRLMLERGYSPTSIGAIAHEAGVSVQTIYNSVGNKASLLSAVIDRTATDSDAPDLVPEAMRKRVTGARNATEIIRMLVDWLIEVNERTAKVYRVISQAAAVDADVAELEQRRATQRLHHFGEAASALRERHGLRSGLSDYEAAAAIWAIGHPQVYQALVADLGWSTEAYREWLDKTLIGALS